MNTPRPLSTIACTMVACWLGLSPTFANGNETRIYQNKLTRLDDPGPLLADYPEFVQPVIELNRYQAPAIVDEPGADLHVRAWRFSYNARGIVEMPNHLLAAHTAVIMVHPWGIDDGQGWRTPQPAGAADFCTEEKNHLAARHTRQVIDPFIGSLRGRVPLVMFSLPGSEDPIRQKLYRSIRGKPTPEERLQGAAELHTVLNGFEYTGQPLPEAFAVSQELPVRDYFQQFPGLDASPQYNNAGFWELPIPITKDIQHAPEDVVIYDAEGYTPLRDFLKEQGIRHVLLTGYATDMCFCRTTAGYENLSKDFNVFLVGDASLATFPANDTPRYATNAHISFAALTQLVTQVSWVQYQPQADAGGSTGGARCGAPKEDEEDEEDADEEDDPSDDSDESDDDDDDDETEETDPAAPRASVRAPSRPGAPTTEEDDDSDTEDEEAVDSWQGTWRSNRKQDRHSVWWMIEELGGNTSVRIIYRRKDAETGSARGVDVVVEGNTLKMRVVFDKRPSNAFADFSVELTREGDHAKGKSHIGNTSKSVSLTRVAETASPQAEELREVPLPEAETLDDESGDLLLSGIGKLRPLYLLETTPAEGFTAASMSPDGKWLATYDFTEDERTIIIRALADGSLVKSLPVDGNPADLAFSPDSQFLAANIFTPTSTEENEIVIWDTANWEASEPLAIPVEATKVAIGPGGKFLAYGAPQGTGQDLPLVVWDVDAQKELTNLLEVVPGWHQFVFSADGKWLLRGGVSADRHAVVRVYDTKTWQAKRTLTASGTNSQAMVLATDQKTLALQSAPKGVAVFEVNSAKVVTELPFSQPLTDLCFLQGKRYLLGSTPVGDLTAYDIGQKKLTSAKMTNTGGGGRNPIIRLIASRDGKLVFAVQKDGEITLWRFVAATR